MRSTQVLIISGPIASGKSATAHALAAAFRAGGHTAAVVDLDRVCMMLDDRPPMDDPSTSRQARRAAAALTDQFVLDGIDLVIVEGTFWTRSERDDFTRRLSSGVDPVVVTLRVSIDEALRRVQADTGRRASRNPQLLRASHASFAAATPIATDITLDSTGATLDDVMRTILATLQRVSSRRVNGDVGPLFRDVDCLQVPVPDLDAGLAFYREALGHPLVWRTRTAAGVQMAESSTEVVIQSERAELEVNLSVASADAAAAAIVRAGGALSVPPFDIAIGRCAVVQDPWGNRLVVLDHSKGRLLTDATGRVLLDPDGHAQTQASR